MVTGREDSLLPVRVFHTTTMVLSRVWLLAPAARRPSAEIATAPTGARVS